MSANWSSPQARAVRSPSHAGAALTSSKRLSKVLIANRGEIAVRIIRAARDEGIASVAVYADPDRDALHVRLADEAYALGGNTAAESYLVMDKIIDVAQQSGADAIHPGYGFLAENAEFAAKVIDAGITWIGPSPEAISALGDKVQARHIAEKVGAPQVPGTADPVESAEEILKFAENSACPSPSRLPSAAAAAASRWPAPCEEIPELFESAVREAVAAFGRGECFIERFLDAPRHVETQCLADAFGNVVVVSTRDCSLQRRNQKLVEEAPAPFLTEEQNRRLYESSKAILKEARLPRRRNVRIPGGPGRHHLLPRGQHPPPGGALRLRGSHRHRPRPRAVPAWPAAKKLGYDDPEVRGHSFEFRITGEDPGRNFMPAPGTITTLKNPTGPGIRIDSGVEQGDVISGNFDSMLSKLIVTGATRDQALQRSRRALEEMVVEGIPTVIPFDLAVVTNPDFAPAEGPFKVHTRWIETEFVNDIPAWSANGTDAEAADAGDRQRVVVEVGGKRLEVVLPCVARLPVAAPAAGCKAGQVQEALPFAGGSGRGRRRQRPHLPHAGDHRQGGRR